jgi:hypothetical protein
LLTKRVYINGRFGSLLEYKNKESLLGQRFYPVFLESCGKGEESCPFFCVVGNTVEMIFNLFLSYYT